MFNWIKNVFKREKPNIDPTTLAFAIREAKLAYPSLFGSAASVLNHLYLVIGNGYDWVDGGLVEICDDGKGVRVREMLLAGVPESKIKKLVAKEDRERHEEMFGKYDRERRERRKQYSLMMRFRLWRLDRELAISSKNESSKPSGSIHPYPICEYSALWDIPDDAKPDWVAGAYEAARLALVHDSYNERDTKNNIKWVAKAVGRLDKKFGAFNRPSHTSIEELDAFRAFLGEALCN